MHVRLDGPDADIPVRRDARPLRIDVDPEFDVFRTLDASETPPTLSEMFGQEYTLFLASNAAEALDILSREKVHVVVSDFKMPGMDGLALLMEVKRRHPLCARVLMTAYADMQLVIRA